MTTGTGGADGADDAPWQPDGGGGPSVPRVTTLPEPVRGRVIALAAARLGSLDDAEVPPALRAVRRFTPSKRARLGSAALAAALEEDEAFRAAVADSVRSGLPDLAAALERGEPPPAALPEDVAAAAYVLREEGWARVLAGAVASVREAQEARRSTSAAVEVERLRGELAEQRRHAHTALATARAEVAAVRTEFDEFRRRVRSGGHRGRRAEAAAAAAVARAEEERDAALAEAAEARTAAARAEDRAAAAEASLDAARRATRDDRVQEHARLRVLLDTLMSSAQGLRRELSLPPARSTPADGVVEDLVAVPDALAGFAARGLPADSPELLDRLGEVPGLHLIVDGYNVTKTGYGTVPLEAQRGRLAAGLAALAARTRAEVTVVFDGAERPGPLATPSPRGVRVVFSRAGTTADEVIVRIVRGEPPGRPVAVVSSDREVADNVRRLGALPVASPALLNRLERP